MALASHFIAIIWRTRWFLIAHFYQYLFSLLLYLPRSVTLNKNQKFILLTFFLDAKISQKYHTGISTPTSGSLVRGPHSNQSRAFLSPSFQPIDSQLDIGGLPQNHYLWSNAIASYNQDHGGLQNHFWRKVIFYYHTLASNYLIICWK